MSGTAVNYIRRLCGPCAKEARLRREAASGRHPAKALLQRPRTSGKRRSGIKPLYPPHHTPLSRAPLAGGSAPRPRPAGAGRVTSPIHAAAQLAPPGRSPWQRGRQPAGNDFQLHASRPPHRACAPRLSRGRPPLPSSFPPPPALCGTAVSGSLCVGASDCLGLEPVAANATALRGYLSKIHVNVFHDRCWHILTLGL